MPSKQWNAHAVDACDTMANALIMLNAAGNPYCEQYDGSAYGMLSNALREALDIMLPEVLTELFYEGLVFECCDMQYLLAYYKLVD